MIFGAKETFNKPDRFTDHTGTYHQIKFRGFPDLELGYQGKLSDLAKSRGLHPLWDILGWELGADSRVVCQKIGLDFDLDYFAISWKEYIFPWPEEVFENEFLNRSTYNPTEAYSAQNFIRGLVEGAGLITLAREPKHCGGGAKADWILDPLNHYVFNGDLCFR